MEDLLYQFLRLDPEVVKRYPKSERTLLQSYSIIVLIGCMTALGIWCTGLSLLFNNFVALIGVAVAIFVWRFDTALLTIRGTRPILTRLVAGLILSLLTTFCFGIVVYYQTAVYQAEQEAKMAELEAREKVGLQLDAHRLKIEEKYKAELARVEKFYSGKIDKLMQEQLRSAKSYSASGVKKEQKPPAQNSPEHMEQLLNGTDSDNNAYQTPNKAEQYVDTVLQKQIDMFVTQWNNEKDRIYAQIEKEVEAARQHIFYAPEIEANITIGNVWGKIVDTAFNRDTSRLTLSGVLYVVCLLIEFFPFVIRVLALSFTKFIKENTD